MSDRTNRPAQNPEENPGQGDFSADNGPSQDDLGETVEEQSRRRSVPCGLNKKILADLPPPEEMERLYQDLQEYGSRWPIAQD